ncbi:MAG: NAD(P)-binding domain-containing protein, partial [Planctomyces sp.]
MPSSTPQQLVDSLAAKIADRTAKVGIIGLGYVGLPLISAFVNAGFRCIGFDVDAGKVQTLLQGRSYIRHIASETVAGWISKSQLDPTSDMSRLGEADALLICVPTPLNESRDPDLQYIESTAASIAKVLRPGQLVVLESTT